MHWQIEICHKPDRPDPDAASVHADIRDSGISSVKQVQVVRIYILEGNLDEADIRKIAEQLLTDPVTELYECNASVLDESAANVSVVQVLRKPGVTDPVEASATKAIEDLGLCVDSVRTARKYLLGGQLDEEMVRFIATRILANDVIDEIRIGSGPIPIHPQSLTYKFEKKTVRLLNATDEQLEQISRDGTLSLNLAEMQTIKDYFTQLKRDPTDIELETIAQTWSEHCVHKTFRGIVKYDGRIIDNLLKNTVMKATKDLDKPWCVSVFKDNAGVIRFDEDHDVCFKVETHNHPSAIEPYGGAGTGIGGVIRDPLGTGLGAKPILNTDVFCFAPPDIEHDELPAGVLHPKRAMTGVVSGVRDYGNRMGIPTANGALYFDKRYLGNPLVYCGTVGIMPRGSSEKAARKDDLVVVVGGRTGRDGIHGATFSSLELTEESETVSSGAVQIGNPIIEKKTVDTILQARDKGLYTCITDCGAGGLSSAVGEMGEEIGAVVDLEKVPLKYSGLSYTEIWISEAQERMVIAVPPENEAEIMSLFNAEDVEATTIGRFTDDKKLHLRYNGETVGVIDMDFLHNGVPRLHREAVWSEPTYSEPNIRDIEDYASVLKRILGSWNVCSKEWIIRQYDHEVQGATILKPLQGPNEGPGDACIITPVLGSARGLIISCGMNPRYGDIDPYHMAASAIDEAIRQIIAVGGSLDTIALLDNFCWGNTDKPDRLGGFVRAAEACRDYAIAFGTPFVSGKDSLNNEFQTEGETIAIPPSLLISAMSVMEDVTKAVTMDAKEPGNLVYAVGTTKNELGGSHFYGLFDAIGSNVPRVDADLALTVMGSLSKASREGLVRSCHDCSEGGLAVALAEMAFAGDWGMQVSLHHVPTSGDVLDAGTILFSESNSRFVVEVEPKCQSAFEALMPRKCYGMIGMITSDRCFSVTGLEGEEIISVPISELKEAWQKPLLW